MATYDISSSNAAIVLTERAGNVITITNPAGWGWNTLTASTQTVLDTYAFDLGYMGAGSSGYWYDSFNKVRNDAMGVLALFGSCTTSSSKDDVIRNYGPSGSLNGSYQILISETGTIDGYTWLRGCTFQVAYHWIPDDYRCMLVTVPTSEFSSVPGRLLLMYQSTTNSVLDGFDIGFDLPYNNIDPISDIIFGVDKTAVYYWSGYYGHLYKYNLVTRAKVVVASSFYPSTYGYTWAVQVGTTSIWHLYHMEQGTANILVLKLDTSTDTLSFHSSSTIVLSQPAAGYEEVKFTPKSYFTLDGGTTNQITFPLLEFSTARRRVVTISYTTNPDSLTVVEDLIPDFNNYATPEYSQYFDANPFVGPETYEIYGASIEVQKDVLGVYAGYVVLYRMGKPTGSYNGYSVWVNYAPLGRSALEFSGWIMTGSSIATSSTQSGEEAQLHGVMSTMGEIIDVDNTYVNLAVYSGDSSGNDYDIHNINFWQTLRQEVQVSSLGQITLTSGATTTQDMAAKVSGLLSLIANVVASMLFVPTAGNYLVLRAEALMRITTRRLLEHGWSIGAIRNLIHEEYIVGTDIYNSMLGKVNVARASESPPLPPYKTTLSNTATQIAFDWAQYHNRQQLAHDKYAHEDPSFDLGWQTNAQKLTTMNSFASNQPVAFSENLGTSAISTVPPYTTYPDPDVRTAASYATEHFDSWWASPVHKANILFDWSVTNSQNVVYMGFAIDWSHDHSAYSVAPGSLTVQHFYDLSSTILGNAMQRTWINKYALTEAQLINFTGAYDLVAWVDVRKQIDINYGIRISSTRSFLYGTRVAAQLNFPIHFTINKAIKFSYTGTTPITVQRGFLYDLARVRKQMKLIYPIKITKSIRFEYDEGFKIVSSLSTPYSLRTRLLKQINIPYDNVISIKAQRKSIYSLLSYNPISVRVKLPYTLISQQVINSTDAVFVMVDGVKIPVLSANVSISEGDFLWKAKLSIAGLGEYNIFVQDYPFEVHLGTDVYKFVVEERSLDRSSPANVKISIMGFSPSIKFKSPRTALIDFELPNPMMAKDIVEAILGETVQWNIINWLVPAYRVAATNISPIKLVSQIVSAVGGIPESLLDGTLQIRYKWKINTNQYALTVADQIYTDVEDNLSASEQTQPFEYRDKFRIREGGSVFSDRIEFFNNDDIDGSDLSGLLRAYPSPWRTTVQITQTNQPLLTLNYEGIIQRTEIQMVQFVEGKGSVSYPIVSIDSIDWRTYNLGSLTNELHGKDITAPTTVNDGYGLAEITYTTEAITYSTSTPVPTDGQFLLEDIG